MSEGPQLDDLLGLLAGEGEFHSRGEFTLDPGRNREKIASLLRQDSLSWLYWLVRCGVSLESRSCEILVGRNALVARLHLTSGQHLVEFLDQGSDSGHVTLHYLRSALLWTQSWLGLHPGFAASLVLEQPELPHLALSLESDRVVRQQEQSSGQNLCLTLALLPGPQTQSQTVMLEQRRLLQAQLPERLAFCPMPVQLDGQRVDGQTLGQAEVPLYLRYYLHNRRRDGLGVPFPPPAHYYRLETETPRLWPRPRFCLPPVQLHTFSLAGELPAGVNWSLAEGLTVGEWRTEKEATRLSAHPLQVLHTEDRWLVRAQLLRQGANADAWAVVQHGVRLEWEVLDLDPLVPLGWQAVIGLDGAQTDLSGLRLVRDGLYEELHQWLRGEIDEVHDRQVAGCH